MTEAPVVREAAERVRPALVYAEAQRSLRTADYNMINPDAAGDPTAWMGVAHARQAGVITVRRSTPRSPRR